MQRLQIGPRTDRPHTLKLNLRMCRKLKIDESFEWWAGVLAFDALIGNTDRHPENWGFLKRIYAAQPPGWSFAPIFDNGTSLGYELVEERLQEASTSGQLARYID